MLTPTHEDEDLAGPPAPIADDVPGLWALDPEVAFLNHGSFGARLHSVIEVQDGWRRRIEAHPIQLVHCRRDELLAEARREVGAWLGMTPASFGFVTNATGGVNAVVRSLSFGPGEELLTTDHVYNGVRRALEHLADRSGAAYREVELPVPVSGPDDVVEVIDAALSDRTRLLVVDHVTSPTALRFPVERVIERCRDRGVDVLIDGAHAPGMIDLHVEALGAAYYTGNLHKWVSAPMGTAFLWVRPDRQPGIHPPVISHFRDEGMSREFGWQGTRDVSGWLTAPAAIEHLGRLGWAQVREHNHRLAVWVQRLLTTRWSVAPISPLDGSMLGSMVTVRLPDGLADRFEAPDVVQALLYGRHRIEVPVFEWSGSWWTRPCCQIYNVAAQYERLAEAVLELTP